MNDVTFQKAFTDVGCLPHQATFAASFLAVDSPRKHLLVSAPGMGKGFVSALIVNNALLSGQARRVLVLSRSALVAQWQELIRRGQPDVPVMIVDRHLLREMDASQPVGAEI
jgi:superfamily II DNA or RNA helicase